MSVQGPRENQPQGDLYAHLLDPNHTGAAEHTAVSEAGSLAVSGATSIRGSDIRVAQAAGTYIAPPSDAQIANAAKYGFDLAQQKKYYSDAEWANRNKK